MCGPQREGDTLVTRGSWAGTPSGISGESGDGDGHYTARGSVRLPFLPQGPLLPGLQAGTPAPGHADGDGPGDEAVCPEYFTQLQASGSHKPGQSSSTPKGQQVGTAEQETA